MSSPRPSSGFDPRGAWDTKENAQAYDRYARTYAMYQETSRDLLDIAEVAEGMSVVDLGCGTGVTTGKALELVGSSGRVIGVDSSEEMLRVAQERITAPNVEFVHSLAENFDEKVDGTVDVVVSNSAFWQMRRGETVEAVKQILQPAGRLAFNLGGRFFNFDLPPEKTPDFSAIFQRIGEIAQELYGYSPSEGRGMRLPEPLGFNGWVGAMTDFGFELVAHKVVEYERTAEESYEWQRVPVFASMMLPGLDYEKRMAVYERAYWEIVPRDEVYSSRWIYFVFTPALSDLPPGPASP